MIKKIALITGCDDTYQPLMDLSLPGKKEYCKMHGYDIVVVKDIFNTTRFRPAWEKIPVITFHAQKYAWVFWSDADSLIMNPQIAIEDSIDDNSIIIASLLQFNKNDPHIHFGNFMVKNSRIANQMLMKAYSYKTTWKHDPQEEEGAFFHMVWKKMPLFQQMVKRMSWNTFFSLPCGFPQPHEMHIDIRKYQWTMDTFIVHMTKPLSLDERIASMESYLHKL